MNGTPTPYQRKTKDVFVVQGNYGYGWDDLTYCDSYSEAKQDKKDYDANEPYAHRIIKKREKL